MTVAEVEGEGRGRRVTIEELLVLAMTFGTGVTHLRPRSRGDSKLGTRSL